MRPILVLVGVMLLAACSAPRDVATGAVTYRDGIAASADVTDLRVGDSHQRVRILRPQTEPKAVLIVFTGGDGSLDIAADGTIRKPGNFLVRTRADWVAHGFLTIILDTPADHSTLFNYRLSDGYRAIIGAVAAHARSLTPAPIWVTGTSAGAPAAIFAAATQPALVHGAVVSSSVSVPGGNTGETVFAAGPERVRGPVLIQFHREDGCRSTPPGNAARLKAALTASRMVELQEFSGGSPPRSGPCEAFAQHGFIGIEDRVVDAASKWMLAH